MLAALRYKTSSFLTMAPPWRGSRQVTGASSIVGKGPGESAGTNDGRAFGVERPCEFAPKCPETCRNVYNRVMISYSAKVDMEPRVTFFGAAQSVTGSMHLVEFGDQRLLLDCGMARLERDELRSARVSLNSPLIQLRSTPLSSAMPTSITAATCPTWCARVSPGRSTAPHPRAT